MVKVLNMAMLHDFRVKNQREFYMYVLPAMAALLCYLNSLGGQLVHDDIPAILHNMDIRPEQSVFEIFKHDYWGKPMWDNSSHKSYRPFTVLTFRFNYLIDGLHPFGYHLFNIMTHAIVTILFTHVCFLYIFKNSHSSLFAGLIFAVHPIHTEVVSNIVSRAEILSGLFFLLSYISFMCGFRKKKLTSSLMKCVLFAVIAMLSKEQGITVLGLCWAYCVISMLYHPTGKGKNNHKTKLAVLTVSIVAILSARLILQQRTVPRFHREDNPASFEENYITRWLTHWYIYTLNGWLLIWPCVLSHDWQFGTIPLIQYFTDTRNLYTALFICVVGGRGLRAVFTKSDAVGRIGLLFLIVPFLPACNLFFNVGFVLAERTLYIPSMGYIILLVQGIQYIYTMFGSKKCTSMFFIMLLSFATKTIIRNNAWQSRETIAWSGIEVFPHNAKMQFNFANVLRDHGLEHKAKIHYKEAIRLWPGYASAHNNLATMLLTMNTSEAKHHFQEAIKACPFHANAHFNLGTQLWLEGDYKHAVLYLEKTLSLDPRCAQCHINLASLHCDMNRLSKAITHFNKALSMTTDMHMVAKRYLSCLENVEKPHPSQYSSNANTENESVKNSTSESPVTSRNQHDSLNSHNYSHTKLITTDFIQKNWTDRHTINKKPSASNLFQKHIKDFQPNVTIKLAVLLAKSGNHLQAASLLEEVVDEVHGNSTKAEVYFLLGECYKDTGKIEHAIIAFQNTVMLSNKHVGAHHNLAVAYHYQRDLTNARIHYKAALQLEPSNHLLLQNYKKFEALVSML